MRPDSYIVSGGPKYASSSTNTFIHIYEYIHIWIFTFSCVLAHIRVQLFILYHYMYIFVYTYKYIHTYICRIIYFEFKLCYLVGAFKWWGGLSPPLASLHASCNLWDLWICTNLNVYNRICIAVNHCAQTYLNYYNIAKICIFSLYSFFCVNINF